VLAAVVRGAPWPSSSRWPLRPSPPECQRKGQSGKKNEPLHGKSPVSIRNIDASRQNYEEAARFSLLDQSEISDCLLANLHTGMNITKLLKRFRIDDPESFRLVCFNASDTGGIDLDKDEAKVLLAADIKRLAQLQKRLYADGHWAVLIVLQGMDAAGKDSVIAHVMTGLNPQGCEVRAFKAPSEEELAHDFLWRSALRLPERGRIGIFNRSHYEEVLVVRVHPELLKRQKLPPSLVTRDIWIQRFKDIRGFERHLARNGVLVLKFFLHISKEEQRRRLVARLEEPDKRWKFSFNDIAEHRLWDKYMAVYEDMIQATSRKQAPWYVVPADNKPFARLVVAAALVEALEGLDLQFPKLEAVRLREIQQVRDVLKSWISTWGGGTVRG
jgi:PPK2 family polyphosphate:nucleotide phosphotransferase